MTPKRRAFWIKIMISFDRTDHCHDPFNWNKRPKMAKNGQKRVILYSKIQPKGVDFCIFFSTPSP